MWGLAREMLFSGILIVSERGFQTFCEFVHCFNRFLDFDMMLWEKKLTENPIAIKILPKTVLVVETRVRKTAPIRLNCLFLKVIPLKLYE